MQDFTIKSLYLVLITIFLNTTISVFAQASNNNSFVFNGTSSQLYVYDGVITAGANQDGFKFFNNSASNNKITVQAWIYLIGDTPPNVEVPIIYRTVNNGRTFSLYLKNNVAYFSVGNNNTATVNTNTSLPAFQWISLTGSYDGNTLKIYLGGSLIDSAPFNITPSYTITNGSTGLFVGKSNTGAFKGLIDEIRIFNIALGDNNINGSGGNGNPAENIPSSILQYLTGEWSFTEISSGNLLYDLSTYKNHLHVDNINQTVPSKNIPFFVVTSASDDPDALIGDGSPVSTNGKVTLRSAIQEANTGSNLNIIYFYIKGASPVIQPLSQLPAITQPAFLDATTQSGYIGLPIIQINGTYGNLTISGGGNSVTGLAINSTAGFGLTFTNIGGNNIFANQISGISLGSSNNNINNNSITNSIGDGISIAAGVGNNVISNNTISGNNGNGISETNANGNSISSNTISSNSLNGINISSSSGIITGNSITGNNGVGMSLNSNTLNQITNNNIENNSSGGISLVNTAGTLSSNNITGNQGYGISLSASNNTLSGNIISGNSNHGIIISGSNNSISNDTVFNNGTSGTGVGVSVQTGSNNSILNNSIYDNSTLGIQLITPANNSQSYPVLNKFYTWQDKTALPKIKGGTAIQGTLNSTPGENYKIQFFANTSSSNREGRRFLGEIEAATDISGKADFFANLTNAVLTDDEVISATATKLSNNNPLSTSEFSESISRSTDEGLHYKVNTTLAGIPLHWKDGKSIYHIAQSMIDLGYDTPVEAGFNTWTTLSQLHYSRGSTIASEHWGGNADGINNVVMIPNETEWTDSIGAPTNVLAVTRLRYNALNGEITDADIAFNRTPESLAGLGTYYWATNGDTDKVDVQNTATHEIGHYSGLADLYNPGDFLYLMDMKYNNQVATMYGLIDVGELYKRDIHPDSANQATITTEDIGGINYIYSHLGTVYYDIVLVFDNNVNFTSPDVLNGFVPSVNAASELIAHLRVGDKIGWVNGTNQIQSIGDNFNQLITSMNSLEPNTGGGNLADRITAAENMLNTSSPNKKIIILYSAGEVSPVTQITGLSLNPDIKIYTMGFEGIDAGQDLMSWLANETYGEYYKMESSSEIPTVTNVIWLRLLGLQISYLSGEISSDIISNGQAWQGGTLDMGVSWKGSLYNFIIIPPGVYYQLPLDTNNIPPGLITESNYDTSRFDIEFYNGYQGNNPIPYKFFRINHPTIGQWRYAIIEKVAPDSTEPIRVYMANSSDLVLQFSTDQDRYYVKEDNSGNPIAVTVNFTAKVLQAGNTKGIDGHVITEGTPVDTAIVVIQVTAPDGETVLRQLSPEGNGIYKASLVTSVLGNYNVNVNASDNHPVNGYNNSQYLITSKASFYVSPYNQPPENTGAFLITKALNELNKIMTKYCSSKNDCSLDKNTAKNINAAISLISSALNYFGSDGNHLNTKKGLNFYDNITTTVNDIYAYLDNTDFGSNIGNALEYLFEGTYKITVLARDEAEAYIGNGDCQLSNCDETLKSANTEIGKAILDSKDNNYVYGYNHLTNAWKFAENIMGANLKKIAADENSVKNLPKEYALSQNYPNPFNPVTRIDYQLPEKNHVALRIYNILGEVVATLVDREMDAGYYSVNWDAGNLASGIYFYRLNSGSFISTKKLILMK